MQSLKELYRIGNGPSSSHTMGPSKLANIFMAKYPTADRYEATLYASLALTGAGHLTDKAIESVWAKIPHKIIFDVWTKVEHPNTMDMCAYNNGKKIGELRAYSVGGGAVELKGQPRVVDEKVYPQKNFKQIKMFCEKNNVDLYEFAVMHEGESLVAHLKDVWATMEFAVKEGLEASGTLPGKINLTRKAKLIHENKDREARVLEGLKESRLIFSYAYAVSEVNANGGVVVTAPTCGACGVLPAVLHYCKVELNVKDEQIVRALAVAGVIGNVFKTNGSISGAEGGCQAEVGTACSMAAAAYGYLMGFGLDIIESAAEIAMEHHLGLTCDPVMGYVQVPCIERNAVAAIRGMRAVNLAVLVKTTPKIWCLDAIVETAYKTGKDLRTSYRETAAGGLAKTFGKAIWTKERESAARKHSKKHGKTHAAAIQGKKAKPAKKKNKK